MVPHITDAIQDWIEEVAKVPVDGKEGSPDVCVIELGGTVGDIESSPFVEALRQAFCPTPHSCWFMLCTHSCLQYSTAAVDVLSLGSCVCTVDIRPILFIQNKSIQPEFAGLAINLFWTGITTSQRLEQQPPLHILSGL